MRAIETITGRVSGAEPRRRRHRPDHPQAVPQARRAHRLRRVPVLRLGEGAGLGAAEEPDPRRRAELRLRLEPRARPVGAGGLRLPGDHRAELRRHLPLQLHEDRAAPGRAARAYALRGDRRGRRGPGRPRRPGGALAGRDGALRDRPGDQAPAAERPRRHRADARAGAMRSTPTSATASASGPVTTAL